MKQFGFSPGHSTELAALRLVNHFTNEMDNFNVPINIYINVSKAFDSLNHFILLNKLYLVVLRSYFVVICRTDYNSLILMVKCPQNWLY